MAKALEELVMEELDTLYRGALFLSAGDRGHADRLLHDTAIAAYRAGALDGRLVGPQPLERMMIRCFRERSASGVAPLPAAARATRPAGLDGDLTPATLFRAAGAVPPEARAVLWLVAIRRWSYEDTATLLRVDHEGLENLLAYRDVFMSAAMRSSGIRQGRKAE